MADPEAFDIFNFIGGSASESDAEAEAAAEGATEHEDSGNSSEDEEVPCGKGRPHLGAGKDGCDTPVGSARPHVEQSAAASSEDEALGACPPRPPSAEAEEAGAMTHVLSVSRGCVLAVACVY